MNPRVRNVTVAISLVVLIVGGVVWGWTRSSDSRQSTLPKELSVASLKAQIADPAAAGETIRNTFERDDLTEEQRRELRGNMRQVFQAMMDEHVNEYFSATEEEKLAVLDKHIDEMQKHMERWRERREQWEKERKEKGEAEPTAEEREARWRERAGSQTQGQRKEQSESRNPDDMARRMAYFSAVHQRMSARGIEMPWGRGGGPGGPGRWGGGPG